MEEEINEDYNSSKKWFEDRYKKMGGKIVQVQLKPSIRINTLKTTHEKITNRLYEIGVDLKKIPFTRDGYSIEKSRFSLGAIKEYLLGYYYLQGAASQLAVEALNPQEGELILDCCAAPGGKTTQIAQLSNNKSKIIALEKKTPRIDSLLNNLERLGIHNTLVYNLDAENVSQLNLEFDKILLDVECSGNYITDEKFFKRTTRDTILQNATLQKTLLRSTIDTLKEGGELIYSTCSLEPEENELIIDWVLRKLPVKLIETNIKTGDPGLTDIFGTKLNKTIKLCKRFWPFKTKTQGFFIAKLKKVNGIKTQTTEDK